MGTLDSSMDQRGHGRLRFRFVFYPRIPTSTAKNAFFASVLRFPYRKEIRA
jgi:hypothetical protein